MGKFLRWNCKVCRDLPAERGEGSGFQASDAQQGKRNSPNFRNSLATFLVSRGKDVKTIQELRRHAKVSTTLDLYSRPIDTAKLEAQEDIALAIRSSAAAAD